MNASGVDTIMAQFHGRFDVLGPGHHFMHDVQIGFEGNDQARGRVSGHAELWRRGQMMVTAIRYDDIYRNTADGWKIADRPISIPYYVPVAEPPDILRTLDSNQASVEQKQAEF